MAEAVRPAHDRTILVIDEVPFFRDLARGMLAATARVVTAAGGDEALSLARRSPPDLILTDLMMPGMDGEALCRAVRADPALAGTPVIVLYASDLAEDRARAVRAGASDVLPKPVVRSILLEGVVRLLASRPPRGLPRVEFSEPFPVRMRSSGSESWGRARNLSRSGIFVESSELEKAGDELDLDFRVPEAGIAFRPSARVVWRRGARADAPGGMGMAFLALDRLSVRRLVEYVSDRAPRDATPSPLA